MKKAFFVFLMITLVWSCSRDTGLSADFEKFYEKFHEDSSYQIAHIPFPIEGVPSFSDSLASADPNFRWTMDNWKIHRPFDFEGSAYSQTFTALGDDIIVEQIKHSSGSFAMVRRFARLGGEWYLIYFADMNPVKTNKNLQIEGGFSE